MNVLFLTMLDNMDINRRGIYNDVMRRFRNDGHKVYIVCTVERKMGQKTYVSKDEDVKILHVRTLNLQKTNIVEKGMGQLSIEMLFKRAIKKHFAGVDFDLILYSTPPITFPKVIEYAKKVNPKAMSYLLLKDIFPQNAVDLGMMTKSGLKGILYRMFRKKEEELYRITDYIGCMSPANVEYVLKHNPSVDRAKVEVAPNSYDVPAAYDAVDKESIRKKYNLPTGRPVFLYGGNMGKPQGIPFLVECMKAVKDRKDCHFLLVGDGTEYTKLESFVAENQPKSISVFRRLPKADYDALAAACDVGLIFLDYRFSIPNYPSRLLPYLIGKKPILAATDPNCDTGLIAEENGYGFYCPSNSVEEFVKAVDKILASDIKQMGENGYQFFLNNYTTEHTYNAIINHLK